MKGSILVVDDSSANLLALQTILDREGLTVYAAISGKDAFDILSTEEIDVIILDIIMPVMDGYEVLQKLQKDEATRDIPIVMISAKYNVNDVMKAIELGALDYIKKPIDINELMTRVMVALRMRSQQVSLSQISKIKKSNMKTLTKLINTIGTSNKELSEILEKQKISEDFKKQIEKNIASSNDLITYLSGIL